MNDLLEVINTCITATGNLPVSSAATPHPGVIFAKSIIERVNRRVQSRGYWFNREYGVEFIPQTDGTIMVPSNVLTCDAIGAAQNVVMQGRQFYNMTTRSLIFPSDTVVTADIVVLREYEDLPPTVFNYIEAKALLKFLVQQHGEKEKIADAKQEVFDTGVLLTRNELQTEDPNATLSPAAKAMLYKLGTKVWLGGGTLAISRREVVDG